MPITIPAVALDGAATLSITATGTLSLAVALTGTATLQLFAVAEFPAAGLPVDARDESLAIEYYADIGSVHVGTRDIVVAGTVYKAAILDTPQIERSLDNLWYGWDEVSRGRLLIANPDGEYDGLFPATGQAITIWRHDRRAFPTVTLRDYDGIVDQVTLGQGTEGKAIMVVEYTSRDLSALETLIPQRLTSTTLFGETCPNPGVPIQKIVGTVSNAPLTYVVDDTATSTFVYLVGEGAVSVTAVRRNRAGSTQLEDLTAPEYTVSTVLYAGLTVIVTPTRQAMFGGGFHTLYADVEGDASERNPATLFGAIMGNATWGCGVAVDAATIATEAAALPVQIVLDGIIGGDGQQKPARDWLQQILMVRGGRPRFSPADGWSVHFDSVAPTSIKMILRDAPGAGERTLLRIGRRSTPSLRDRVKSLQIQYGWDFVTGAYLYTTSDRAVGPVGKMDIRAHDLLRVASSADYVASYLARFMALAEDQVTGAVAHEEARALDVLDLVRVDCPQLLINNEDRRVVAIVKGSGEHELIHQAWDVNLYDHVAGTLPTSQTSDPTASEPVAPLITQDLMAGAVGSVYVLVNGGPFAFGAGTATLTTFDVTTTGNQSTVILTAFFQLDGATASLVSLQMSGIGTQAMILEWSQAVTLTDTRMLMTSASNVTAGHHTITIDGASSGAGWTLSDVELTVTELRR